MKVKIIKSTLSSYWYSCYIGHIFTVDEFDVNTKKFSLQRPHDKSGEICYHFIERFDCQVLPNQEPVRENTYGDSKLKHYFV